VAVEVAGARAAAPRREIDSGFPGDVLELPSAEVVIERIAMRHTLARRRELGARDQIDVEQAVAVVVEQRDAAARRLENVVLGRSAAERLRRQARADLERDRDRRTVFR